MGGKPCRPRWRIGPRFRPSQPALACPGTQNWPPVAPRPVFSVVRQPQLPPHRPQASGPNSGARPASPDQMDVRACRDCCLGRGKERVHLGMPVCPAIGWPRLAPAPPPHSTSDQCPGESAAESPGGMNKLTCHVLCCALAPLRLEGRGRPAGEFGGCAAPLGIRDTNPGGLQRRRTGKQRTCRRGALLSPRTSPPSCRR